MSRRWSVTATAANTQALTFAPGVTSQPFSILGSGDTKFEPDETFHVDLSNPVGAALADAQGVGTITNDDTQPTISIANVTHPEGNSGTTPFVFTVQLSNPSYTPITVDALTADDTATVLDNDYAAAAPC